MMATEMATEMTTQPQGNFVFINNPPVAREQTKMTCPHCHDLVTTEIEYKNSTRTHVIFLVLMHLCLCCAPCVYCNEDCKAVEHFCPNCHKFVGRYDG